MDGFVTKSQFAKIYGCSKPYVSQMVAAKRLVLSDDGKLVNVDASLKLLDVTSDPSKVGVRERWKAHREGREFEGVASDAVIAAPAPATSTLPTEQLEIDVSPDPKAQPAEPVRNDYRDARTLREQAQAQIAQLELAKAIGRVLDAESSLRAVVDAHTVARTEIMMLRDRLTQLVAPVTDPRKVYDIISTECERVCAQIQKRALAMAEEAVKA
jgi:hypothetical protein